MKFIDTLKEINTSEQPQFDRFTNLEFYFLLFVTGCIIGWFYEELYFIFIEGWLENRGFLYGPYLPVYGFGAVLMAMTLRGFKKKPVVLFTLAGLVTGTLEYLTGAGMWLIWKRKWWGYENSFCNIQGYVCLRSVLSFAIGGLYLMYVVEPLVRRAVAKTPKKKLNIIATSCFAIMIIDLVITLAIRNPISF